MLGDRVDVVGSGGPDAAEAVGRAARLRDVDVVLRVTESSADALAAIGRGFAAPTVLLVQEPHADLARAAVNAGASGVLTRLADADEILAAIAAVRAGLVVLDGAIRQSPERMHAASSLRTAPAEPLTERERQVLAMLADGLSNRRIAARLAISENTVKAHVAAILGKLGATTRTEAVTAGVRLGLLML